MRNALAPRALVVALSLLVAAVVLIIPATASASSVVWVKVDAATQFPAVNRVKTVNLPAKTDGYAPRWLVAEGAVGVIQSRMSEGRGIPSRIRVMGARWYAGTWNVRYRVVTNGEYSYGKFVVSQGSKRLEFNGYS
jgi:hypothetical protein